MSALGLLIACVKCGASGERAGARFTCSVCGWKNRRSRRASPSERPHTESMRELKQSRRHLRLVPAEEPLEQRPRTRGDCADAPRPCPWVGCRYHLAYEVSFAGGLKERFPGKELEELEHTCALDVADLGPQPLDNVAFLMNVSAERVRQIEAGAFESCKDTQLVTEDDL